SINANGKDADIVGKQDLLYFLVSGGTAQFASVTDDKDDAPARLVALAEVLGGAQNSVIQHVKLARSRLHLGRPAPGGVGIVDRMAVDARTAAKGPADHGRSAFAPRPPDAIGHRRGNATCPGIAGNLRTRVAVAVKGHLVKLAECPQQGRQSLIPLLHSGGRQVRCHHYRRGQRKGVSGKELELLQLAVFINPEVERGETREQLSRLVFYDHRHLHKVDRDGQNGKLTDVGNDSTLAGTLFTRRGCGRGRRVFMRILGSRRCILRKLVLQ